MTDESVFFPDFFDTRSHAKKLDDRMGGLRSQSIKEKKEKPCFRLGMGVFLLRRIFLLE